MTKVIALANQKGGVGKTTTTVNLGVALVRQGYKVLLIDSDPQGNLTDHLGWKNPDELEVTLSSIIGGMIAGRPLDASAGILHHEEGIDLVPSEIELSGTEVSLFTSMSREYKLRNYINKVKGNYDFVLIDCTPSLGMLTINALVAADSVIIPVQAHYLPAKGMTQLIQTIVKVRMELNPALSIDGIIMTMFNNRVNLSKDIAALLRRSYDGSIRIFDTEIPFAIAAAEASAEGKSIFAYEPNSKVTEGYQSFMKEVISNGQSANQ